MIREYAPTIQTIAFGAAMLGIGFWFGVQFIGRLAYNPTGPTFYQQPGWVETAQTANWLALAVFGVGILIVLGVDYYNG